MKKLFLFVGLAALFFASAAVPAIAQDAPAAVIETASAADAIVSVLPDSIQGIAASILEKVPSWVFTVLTIYGTLSLAYQALIAWWHKRVAETADTADDQWTEKLTSATWFKILDKVFYFGGYIGSALGGKKL
ncbi:hypothetical protein OpiT1DRAFT_01312 [Opitutaceae bacterium TAV1]|nr:hypothetical protein OpiT1DRAFT_01312 [Opitutaceae bacterium TAV1]